MVKRKLPRKFNLPFGSGLITEEISIENPHWEPTVQYMEFKEGHAKGLKALRFCVYGNKSFMRNVPLIIGNGDVRRLKKEIRSSNKIKKFLKRLVT